MRLSDVEIRVLGSLLEKQRTTPDAYPLSLNALRLACNQATNRDPVVHYDEGEIRDALTRLGRVRYTRLTSTQGSRAAKFRHLLDETLGLSQPQQAVLAVLMLRGPQTPGELRQRTERLHAFADFEALGAALAALIDAGLVERLDRRPGQKEERYAHRLGGAPTVASAPVADPSAARDRLESPSLESPGPAPHSPSPAPVDPHAARIDRLERQVGELAAQLARICAELGIDEPETPGD